MRLGAYPCKIHTKTLAHNAYESRNINERHRHRYEVNNRYRKKMEAKGLIVSGENMELNLIEMIEVNNHPWFVGVQFHPELKSRILKAHPLFSGFIAASIEVKGETQLEGKNTGVPFV